MKFRNISSTTLQEDELKRLDSLYNREYSEDVKNSIYDYSDDGNIVNDCLRNHSGRWNSTLEKEYGLNDNQFKNMVKNLDNNQVKLVECAVLYRGFENNIDEFFIGQKISDKGYASTSFDKEVAKYYAGSQGTIIHVYVLKGTRGVYIRQYSQRPHEVEFLLPRCTELEVYKINIKTREVYCRLNYL